MRIGFLIAFSLSFSLPLWSDIVECENGDRYNGKVILVDAENIKLDNEITGTLNIPRSKVVCISFRAAKAPPSAAGQSAIPLTSQTNLNALSPNQPFKFDPAAIAKVQSEILGDAGPEANQMFKEMLGGLMSGKLDVGDLRNKAQESLQELKKLQKDLGDDDAAALLGTYSTILENFLKETPATNTAPKSAKPDR